MKKHQRIAVSAFIFRDGKALVARRPKEAALFPDLYEIPGGKVEFGETVKEALKREIKEELSADIEVLEPFHAFTYTVYDGKAHYVEIVFKVELVSEEREIVLTEHQDYKWISRQEIENLEASPETKSSLLEGFIHLESSLHPK